MTVRTSSLTDIRRLSAPGLCVVLFLVAAWTFLPSTGNDFVNYDDMCFVTANDEVQSGTTWKSVGHAFRSSLVANWHPLTTLSHMLDCQLYGLKPWGHHLTNVLLHAANTVLLFVIFRRMTGAVVLSGSINGSRVLLLSDLGRAGQNALLERTGDLRADIVVTGLPTQEEPLSEGLLDAIQPRLIVVADSEFPASERAGARLKERLAQRKTNVIYTRFAGAATIEFRRSGWEVRTMNGVRFKAGDPAPKPETTPAKAEESVASSDPPG